MVSNVYKHGWPYISFTRFCQEINENHLDPILYVSFYILMWYSTTLSTMFCICLSRYYFGLKTRVIIKIESHPFYPIIFALKWMVPCVKKRNELSWDPAQIVLKNVYFNVFQFLIQLSLSLGLHDPYIQLQFISV